MLKAYGPGRPHYAGDLTGGVGFTAGRQQAPIRVFIGQRSTPAGDGVAVLSPSGRPSLLGRLLAKLRRHLSRGRA